MHQQLDVVRLLPYPFAIRTGDIQVIINIKVSLSTLVCLYVETASLFVPTVISILTKRQEGGIGKGGIAKGGIAKGGIAKGGIAKGGIAKGDIGKGDVGKGDIGKGDIGKGDIGKGDI
jgi:hypothetical protein